LLAGALVATVPEEEEDCYAEGDDAEGDADAGADGEGVVFVFLFWS
jgi:hypothetical protein